MEVISLQLGDGFHDLALRVVQPISAALAGAGGEKNLAKPLRKLAKMRPPWAGGQ